MSFRLVMLALRMMNGQFRRHFHLFPRLRSEYYNQYRPYSLLGYVAPSEFAAGIEMWQGFHDPFPKWNVSIEEALAARV